MGSVLPVHLLVHVESKNSDVPGVVAAASSVVTSSQEAIKVLSQILYQCHPVVILHTPPVKTLDTSWYDPGSQEVERTHPTHKFKERLSVWTSEVTHPNTLKVAKRKKTPSSYSLTSTYVLWHSRSPQVDGRKDGWMDGWMEREMDAHVIYTVYDI